VEVHDEMERVGTKLPQVPTSPYCGGMPITKSKHTSSRGATPLGSTPGHIDVIKQDSYVKTSFFIALRQYVGVVVAPTMSQGLLCTHLACGGMPHVLAGQQCERPAIDSDILGGCQQHADEEETRDGTDVGGLQL
jgi:hypothetical protein